MSWTIFSSKYKPEDDQTVDTPANSSKRNCIVCKKKPVQVQCLHCSEHVCLECAQQHVNLVGQESDGAMHLLNEKIDVLDRIAANTRQKIIAERDKIVQQADAERDRSFTLLAQMIEEEKQRIRNKNKELNELPLNEIPIFIRQLKSDVQHLTEQNDSFLNVNSSMPQITLQRPNEKANTNRGPMNRSLFDREDDWEYPNQQKNEKYNGKLSAFRAVRSAKDDDSDRQHNRPPQNEKNSAKSSDIKVIRGGIYEDDDSDRQYNRPQKSEKRNAKSSKVKPSNRSKYDDEEDDHS